MVVLFAITHACVQVYAGKGARTIVFSDTKKEANELVMDKGLGVDAQCLHGDIPQAQRESTLQGFRDGRFSCLVATDVAARGLDIPNVDLVIQVRSTASGLYCAPSHALP